MPTTYGSRFISPATAIAFRPRENFAQQREDADRELQYQNMVNQELATRVAAKEKTEAEMQRQMGIVSSLGLLSPDNARAQMVNEDYRQKLVDRIKTQYGGDGQKFMEVEGDTWNKQFINALQNNKTIQQGILNKTNKGLFDSDMEKGHIIRNVTYSKTGDDGKPITAQGTFEDNYRDYLNGKAPQLSYNGSFEFNAKDMKKFANEHPDPTGQNREIWSPEDVMAWGSSNGINPNDTKLWIDRHYEQEKNGIQWYNQGNIIKWAELEEQKHRDALAHNDRASALAQTKKYQGWKMSGGGQPHTQKINLLELDPQDLIGTSKVPVNNNGVTEAVSVHQYKTAENTKSALAAQNFIRPVAGFMDMKTTDKDGNITSVHQTKTTAGYRFNPPKGAKAYYSYPNTVQLVVGLMGIQVPSSTTLSKIDPSDLTPDITDVATGEKGLSVKNWGKSAIERNGQLIPAVRIELTGGGYMYYPYSATNLSAQQIAKPNVKEGSVDTNVFTQGAEDDEPPTPTGE